MNNGRERTAIYLVCFHSEKPESLEGTGRQFCKVETAILNAEWPYDNGDDPSFFVARQGGRLTWGVCRQDLRTPIKTGSIVVFFSFTSLARSRILYRLCAVATVGYKTDHCAVHQDRQLTPFRSKYINVLIAPSNEGWHYDETDRRPSQRHKDWLWRMADHRITDKEAFKTKYERVYRSGRFSDDLVVRGGLKLAGNYVVFSADPDCTFISPDPPEVAIAVDGEHEGWSDKELQTLTVGRAAARRRDGRGYLRIVNRSGRNVHRQLRFEMAAEEASEWRADLIEALRKVDGQKRLKTERERTPGNAKC